jgi:hypothetical protein
MDEKTVDVPGRRAKMGVAVRYGGPAGLATLVK